MRVRGYCWGGVLAVFAVIIVILVLFHWWKQPKFLVAHLMADNYLLPDEISDEEPSCDYLLRWTNSEWTAKQLLTQMKEIHVLGARPIAHINAVTFQINNDQSLISTEKQFDCRWTERAVTINVGPESFWNYIHRHLVIERQNTPTN